VHVAVMVVFVAGVLIVCVWAPPFDHDWKSVVSSTMMALRARIFARHGKCA
jgi:hypothetical protein